MLLTSSFSNNNSTGRLRWLVITLLAVIILIVSSSAYLVVRDVSRGREIQRIHQELSAAGRESVPAAAASMRIDEESMTGATIADDVFLTAQTADSSIVFATVVNGTVTNGRLSPNAVIQFPDGSTAEASVAYNGIVRGWQLAKNSVTTAKILDAAVTKAKLANGVVTEVKILNGAIKAKKIATGQIQARHLASGSVVTAKIKNGAITGPKIANNSITAGKIADRSLSTDKFIDQSITDDQLMNGAVGSNQIADGSVTTSKLADGAVTTAKLANLSITAAKIATGTITASQIASDGSVVKSIVGNSIVAVTNNNNGSYSIALTTSCTEGQILKFTGGQWQCASDADTGYFTPQDILRFPRVGMPQTDWWDNGSSSNYRHASQPNYLLYLGAGQNGVVRSLWMTGTTNFTQWTDMDNYELRIYVGAGDIANTAAPPAQYLTAQIPLGILMGAVYDSARAVNTPVSTAILDYMRAGTHTGILLFNAPIPFENGILIQVWKRSPSAVDTTLTSYTWAAYEVGDTSFPYKTWRLKASSARQTLKDTDQSLEFLNTSAKAGMLLGLFSSFKTLSEDFIWDYNEANWTFYPDGASQATWQTSGAEDIFGVNGFYFAAGQQVTPNWGTTFKGSGINSGIHESYRIFTRDPLIWSTGNRGVFPNALYNPAGGGTNMFIANILALYYEEK